MHSVKSDHVIVLKALQELPFPVGKKLFIDILQGYKGNDSIIKHNLNQLSCFGSMAYTEQELKQMIDMLDMNGYISFTTLNGKRYWKVIELTLKGLQEIQNPMLHKKKHSSQIFSKKTTISEKDQELFSQFDFFLSPYNDEQKKAIMSQNNNVLCVAGAGSGKTTVLTKRIEFLVRFQDVLPEKILAVTFTRKAREEMAGRLEKQDVSGVQVETFNSFCEKILRKHSSLIYGKEMKVMAYKDKIMLFKQAITEHQFQTDHVIDFYFSAGQRKSKTKDELMRILLNDCYFIVDYFKSKNKEIENFSNKTVNTFAAKMIYKICRSIDTAMRKQGLRDFMDQIVDCVHFFDDNPEHIPQFDHVLVDEYQDVNDLQIQLLSLLNAENLFCVGDPRQSIYGWRGSNIKYVYQFMDTYPEAELVSLSKNYRSVSPLVALSNNAIKHMNMFDLDAVRGGEREIKLIQFESEDAEYQFICQKLLAREFQLEDVFVLSRTNRQLNELSFLLTQHNIPHIVRSEEKGNGIEAREGEVTLATIHAIKGLEAKHVFVIGCTQQHFPCKGSEHPVIEMVKVEEYDKEDEERRLFYVALSRAKDSLFLTYSGKKHSYYITDEMKQMVDVVDFHKKLVHIR